MKITDAITINKQQKLSESMCSDEEMMKKHMEDEEMMAHKEDAMCDLDDVMKCAEKLAAKMHEMKEMPPKTCEKIADAADCLYDACEMLGCLDKEDKEDKDEEDESCMKK